jgi:hypothetical protein
VLGQGRDDYLVEPLRVPDLLDRRGRVRITDDALGLDPRFAEPVGGGAQMPQRRLLSMVGFGGFPT